MAQVCAVKTCVALAQSDGQYCRIHADRGPEFRTEVAVDHEPEVNGDCSWCNGSGLCTTCEGEGEHTCECGDEHDCGACGGSGKCDACHGTGWKGGCTPKMRQTPEDEYLRWATWVYTPPVLFDRPWDAPCH